MYIRCAACPGKTWVQSGLIAHSARVNCKCCGMSYPLDDLTHLGHSSREHFARAQAFSQAEDLDLAGSYSVLLGILTLEQALDAHRGGDVKRKAKRLAARHGLPANLARQVVERRKRLHEALREARSSPRHRGLRHSSTSDVQRLVATVVGLAGLFGFGWMALRGWDAQVAESERMAQSTEARQVVPATIETPPSAAALRPSAELTYDEQGRLARIAAANPAGVLLAYCDSPESGGAAEALELAGPRGARRDVWLGLFVDRRDAGKVKSIQIQRDRASRRWVAGGSPLEARPIEPGQLGERRFPVATPGAAGRGARWAVDRRPIGRSAG